MVSSSLAESASFRLPDAEEVVRQMAKRVEGTHDDDTEEIASELKPCAASRDTITVDCNSRSRRSFSRELLRGIGAVNMACATIVRCR